jgi:hypothetical protein
MVSRKQFVISAIHEFLGNPHWIRVTDWKPGTGAVITDTRAEETPGGQDPQPDPPERPPAG